MAEIYLGIHDSFLKKAAIKIIKEEISTDSEIKKRFKREAQLIAKLNNPYIVQIYDDGIYKNRYYIILEYMPNGNLRDYLKTNKFSIKKIIELLLPIMDALYFVHSKGIIHRDLKPSNILLNQDYIPKLSDFGISSFLWGGSERLTTTNTAIGTIEYMSPEQKTDAKHVDFRTDIYSMGVILYELLTGKLPMGNFDSPIKTNPRIPLSLNNVILKALNQDKMKRFPSMKIFAQKLKESVSDSELSVNSMNLPDEKPTIIEEQEKEADPFLLELKKLKAGITITNKINIKNKLRKNVKPKHLEIIKENLKTTDGILKEALLLSLGNIRTEQAFEILTEYISSPYYREPAIKGLCYQHTEKAKKELIKILKLPCEKLYKTLDDLVLINVEGIKNKILECLNSDIEEIRRKAIIAFSKIADKGDEKHLIFFIRKENNIEIKLKAKNILESLQIK